MGASFKRFLLFSTCRSLAFQSFAARFRARGVVIMELAAGGSLSDTLYDGVSAEGAVGGVRTPLGDVPWKN